LIGWLNEGFYFGRAINRSVGIAVDMRPRPSSLLLN
jgi:hypothetical protein